MPRSIIVRDQSEVPLLNGLTPPLVIKPANKALVLNSDIDRAVRADTLEQAREVAERMVERAQGLIAQEWIDGPDTEIYFAFFVCDVQSHVVAYFQGRKVVCTPPRIGNTAVCTEASDPTGELERLARQYVSLAGYVGIGGLELKREQRSGRFIIVEPTAGRTDWQPSRPSARTCCFLSSLKTLPISAVGLCPSVRVNVPLRQLLWPVFRRSCLAAFG